jgi:hypothetical protein
MPTSLSPRNARAIAVLFGVAIPALAAGAEQQQKTEQDAALRKAMVNACVEMREKIFECDAEFADLFVKDAPPERKLALRGKALEEIAADGAGPLEPRRKKCGDVVAGAPVPTKEQLAGYEKTVRACYDKPDCKARAACLEPILKMLKPRPRPAAHQ